MEQPGNVIPFPYRPYDFIPVTSRLVNRLANIVIEAGMSEAKSRVFALRLIRTVNERGEAKS